MLKRLFSALLCAIIFILECMPFGVKLIFAGGDGEHWEHLYSYFSLMPFGYATFGPLLCAIITCVILACSILYAFKQIDALLVVNTCLGFVGALLSASQFLYGTEYVTPLAIVITVLLLVMASLSISIRIIDKKHQ